MDRQDHDISSLEALLTLARWHLDASLCAATDAVRAHHERARHVYESIRQVLGHSQLSPSERQGLERELSALRSRMDAV